MSDSLDILAQRMAALDNPRASRPRPAAPSPPSTPAASSMLTLAEAAAMMGVHPKTLAKWRLPFFKEGRVVRVPRVALEEFIRSRCTIPPSHSEN